MLKIVSVSLDPTFDFKEALQVSNLHQTDHYKKPCLKQTPPRNTILCALCRQPMRSFSYNLEKINTVKQFTMYACSSFICLNPSASAKSSFSNDACFGSAFFDLSSVLFLSSGPYS
jgi:hypothetical protein